MGSWQNSGPDGNSDSAAYKDFIMLGLSTAPILAWGLCIFKCLATKPIVSLCHYAYHYMTCMFALSLIYFIFLNEATCILGPVNGGKTLKAHHSFVYSKKRWRKHLLLIARDRCHVVVKTNVTFSVYARRCKIFSAIQRIRGIMDTWITPMICLSGMKGMWFRFNGLKTSKLLLKSLSRGQSFVLVRLPVTFKSDD